jgi:hypothetical protein
MYRERYCFTLIPDPPLKSDSANVEQQKENFGKVKDSLPGKTINKPRLKTDG